MKKISVSSISQFINCRYCWKLHYIDGVELPYGDKAKLGSLIHEQADNYHKGLEYDKELLKAYTQKCSKEYRVSSEEEHIEIIEVEGVKTKVPVHLIIDGLMKNGLCDLKTGGKRPSPSLQSDLYSAWYFMKFKKLPHFTFNWFRQDKQKVYNVGYDPQVPDMINAIKYVNTVIDEIDSCLINNKFEGYNWGARYWYKHHSDCIYYNEINY